MAMRTVRGNSSVPGARVYPHPLLQAEIRRRSGSNRRPEPVLADTASIVYARPGRGELDGNMVKHGVPERKAGLGSSGGRDIRPANLVLCLLLTLIAVIATAQNDETANDETSNGGPRADSAERGGDAPRSIAELTENADRHDGLFTVYRDRNSGAVHMALRPDQLNRDYIYTAITTDGVVEARHFRGNYRDNRIIRISRHYDRVELRAENTAFHFDPQSPLSRAASANISPAVLAVARIVAEDPDSGEVLIRADGFLLNESLHQVRPSPNPDQGPRDAFRLGDLNEERSRLIEVRNYPRNLDFIVEYVYRNQAPLVRGGPDVTDARYVSAVVQHTFLEVPDNNYEPRLVDHRLGHFAERVTDLTSDSVTPYRDLVQRWHLQKRDPGAELSAPVEPIVWWIENTTPLEFRDTIRDAILAWNRSFEKIGYRDAIQVRIQPDNADWDAGDLRYNTVRWTSSPNPPFSGYGPSFTNPRTGQIISANVMLEYASVVRRLQHQRILDANGALLTHAHDDHDHLFCSLAFDLHASQIFGRFAVHGMNLGADAERQLVHEFLAMLTLHEIGHTLGFTHNFAASQLLDLDEVYDPEVARSVPLMSSVMDYADIHVPPPGRAHTRFFQDEPGPYDDWVVEYAYSDAWHDPQAERQRLAAIAARSTDPRLAFGNDADDMRSPGRAIDPRVNVYDLSSDPIGYALDRIELVNHLLSHAADRHVRDGQSFHELADAYVVMLSQLSRSAIIISRYIGGVETTQALVGQDGAGLPFVPVAASEQRRAMAALSQHVFASDALDGGRELYASLQRQRRLFDFSGTTQDPKLHANVLSVQRNILDHLLHPVVLRRITDSRLYGNEYELSEFMPELTDAVFTADLRGDVDTFRQNLQMEYVSRLADIVSGSGRSRFDYPSQSMALFQLREIERMLRGKRRGNMETIAHTQNILHTIEHALDAAGR